VPSDAPFEYTCAVCGGTFWSQPDWSDDDSRAEYIARFPSDPGIKNAEILCEPCYQMVCEGPPPVPLIGDPSKLRENQRVLLRCAECGTTLRFLFSHRLGEIYFFSPPEGGSGVILVAKDDGTLRDDKLHRIEVLVAS
jgi:hypothetical protein